MGRIKLPMGIMDATIRDVTAHKNFLTITADVGAAPNYVGKVEVELSPDDFSGSSAGVAFWVIRKVIPKLLLRAIRRGWPANLVCPVIRLPQDGFPPFH